MVENNGEDYVERGKLSECMAHFRRAFDTKWPKASKGSEEARAPMANFCGVGPNTVREWFYRGILPLGVTYFKLLYFLEMHDYRVVELERMNRNRRHIAELLAFGITEVEEVAKEIGYADVRALLTMMRSRSKLKDTTAEHLWQFWIAHKSGLEEKRTLAIVKYKIDLTPIARSDTREEAGVNPMTIELGPPPQAMPSTFLIMKALSASLDESGLAASDLTKLGRPERETIIGLSVRLSEISVHLVANPGGKDGR